MICKFRAAMLADPALPRIALLMVRAAACVLAGALAAGGAVAERADRSKPMVIEADKPGSVDLQRQVVVFAGNVVITQGTMVIRAERIELRERPDGYREAAAIGSAGSPAVFRQKRDGTDETIEGSAERIDYDSRSDVLRLSGNAAVRRMRGTVVADEITGALITWDNTRELFNVSGGAATPTNPAGRVRAVLAPRDDGGASAPAASATPKAAPRVGPSPRAASTPAGVGETLLRPMPAVGMPR
jgi:lipopolysaccharide export system protein LptA